jgi:hypothetical protein
MKGKKGRGQRERDGGRRLWRRGRQGKVGRGREEVGNGYGKREK